MEEEEDDDDGDEEADYVGRGGCGGRRKYRNLSFSEKDLPLYWRICVASSVSLHKRRHVHDSVVMTCGSVPIFSFISCT